MTVAGFGIYNPFEMSERTVTKLEDRRVSGVSFASALPVHTSLSPEQASEICAGSDPNLFFDSVDIISTSMDRRHAIGFGHDEGRKTLLKDGKPIFEIAEDDIFHVLKQTDDLSRLAVILSTKEVMGIYLVDEKGLVRLEDGEGFNFVWASGDMERFWTSSKGFRHTRLLKTRIDSYNRFPYIEDELHVKNIHPNLIAATEDGSRILWEGRSKNGDTQYVSINQRLLYTGEKVDVIGSADLSKMVAVVHDSSDMKKRKSDVYYNRRRLFRGKFAEVVFEANSDLSAVAIIAGHDDTKTSTILFVMNGKLFQSAPVEEVKSVQVKDKVTIVAQVVRNGVDRVITVGKKDDGNVEDHPKIEDKIAAEIVSAPLAFSGV